MGAPTGNQFWKLRAKHGRDKIFATPEIMLECIDEYFEATNKRTWEKVEYHGKDSDRCIVPIHPPFTWSGLCIFLDVNTVYFNHFKSELDKESDIGKDFSKVITYAENVIRTQKFEGATVGIYNSNIIARDLGLADKKDIVVDTEKKIELNIDGKSIDLGK